MIFDRFFDILDDAPDRACLSEIRRGKTYAVTYADFYADVMRVAAGLPDMRGKRVLVFMRPRIDFFVALLACWVKGAAVLLPNKPRDMRAAKVDRIIADRKTRLIARALFRKTDVLSIERLLRYDRAYSCARPRLDDGETALVTFTSGSGGKAKEIMRTFGELGRTTDFLSAKFSSVRPGDRLLITLPTYVLAALSLGAESVLFFDKKPASAKKNFKRLTEARKVNGIICSAAKLAYVSGVYPDAEKVFVGGSALKMRDAAVYRQKFPRADFRLLYGTSECPVIATAELGEYTEELQNCRILLGRPVGGVRAAVTEGGELTAASELTGGEFRPTGDLGYAENGKLYMRGKRNCSDPANGLYNLTQEIEIEKRFPEIGSVSFLHYRGGNYLFAPICRRKRAEVLDAFPFLRVISKRAPVDAKHGGKLDYRRAVKLVRRLNPRPTNIDDPI